MFPTNSLQSKRWLRCTNVESELTTPPFAIMRLVNLDEKSSSRNRFFNQDLHEDQVVWRVAAAERGIDRDARSRHVRR